jgi:hypothetical protein
MLAFERNAESIGPTKCASLHPKPTIRSAVFGARSADWKRDIISKYGWLYDDSNFPDRG